MNVKHKGGYNIFNLIDDFYITVTDFFNSSFIGGLLGKAFSIILYIVLGKLVLTLSTKLAKKICNTTQSKLDTRKAETLTSVTKSIIKYVIDFFIIYKVLLIIGVPNATIIAIVSVFGVALGLGAQNFVKDIFTGFLILLEDQFAVGDYVSIDNKIGIVENIGLRTTIILTSEGYQIIIPNSEIRTVYNMGKGYGKVILDIPFAVALDTKKIIGILEDEMIKQKQLIFGLTDVPVVLGVNTLNQTIVEIRIEAIVTTGAKDEVTRKLKLAIKTRFDNEKLS